MATLKTRNDADRLARKIGVAKLQIPGETQTSARLLTQGAVTIYRSHAPRRSGRLRRGIRMLSTGGAYVVRADAANPQTGYDYVGVTRKGHRASIIRPRQAKALRIMLPGGGVIFRTHARGYRPASDWAERAHTQVQRLARSSIVRLAQRVERLFR
jgi:hypothetical protein